MTEAIMRASVCRIGATLAGALVLAAWTSIAAAQTAIPSGLQVKRNGVVVAPNPIVYATSADCDGSVTFTFTPTLYSIASPVVEAWLAVGEGKDCTVPANRTHQNTSSAETVCKFLARDTSSSLKPTLSVDGRRLFDGDPPTDTTDNDQYQCDEVRGNPKYHVYIIPLDTATTAVTASAAKSLGTVTTLIATFTPYTILPDAPTNLKAINAESEIGVTYDRPSTSNTYSRYRAYFDYGGSATVDDAGGATDGEDAATNTDEDAGAGAGMDAGIDGGADSEADAASDVGTDAGSTTACASTTLTCGSGLLLGCGTPPPAKTPSLKISSKVAGKSASITDLADIPIGASVAVAVTSIDAAGNESKLSTPVCVQRVKTISYLDACQEAGGDCGLESCGLRVGRRGSALAAAGLALAIAALWRRRRSA